MPCVVTDGTFFSTTERPPIKIGRAGKDFHRRHATGERAREAGVLRPDGILAAHFGGDRLGRFVAVLRGLVGWRGIDAKMRVDVDDAGA